MKFSVYGHKEDNYWDKGAGYLKISYNGLEIEILGQRGNLSMSRPIPNVNNIPTRIEIAKNLWVRSHINPGQYVRGRYGSSYLKHVQSWRSLPTNMNKNSDMSYEHAGDGGWIDCEKPSHHSCLELYEEDGNLSLLPDIHPYQNENI